MKQYISNLKKYTPLLFELVSRDIKTKYRRSILGVFWTLLNPLLMMVILSVVYSQLFKFQIDNFPLYILSGQVIFNFFSEATNTAMSSIILSSSLIRKVYIPKYLFTIAKILSSIVNILASFCALLIVMIFTKAELHYSIVLAIIPMILIAILSTGVGLLLAAFAVKFRDLVHLYGVFTTALMYLSPIIYPMEILPEKVAMVVRINPITNILEIFRGVVMYNSMPGLEVVLMATIPSLLFLFIGFYAFYKKQDTFILNV